MRNFLLAAATAATLVVSFAAPSFAGGYYGGYHRSYDSYDYRPSCFIKKIRTYDYYGNVYIKKIRVCN